MLFSVPFILTPVFPAQAQDDELIDEAIESATETADDSALSSSELDDILDPDEQFPGLEEIEASAVRLATPPAEEGESSSASRPAEPADEDAEPVASIEPALPPDDEAAPTDDVMEDPEPARDGVEIGLLDSSPFADESPFSSVSSIPIPSAQMDSGSATDSASEDGSSAREAPPLPSPAGEDEEGPALESVWDLVRKALERASIIMGALLVLSIIGVMLVFYFLVALTKTRIASGRFLRGAESLIEQGDYLGLLRMTNQNNQAASQIVGKSIDFVTKNPDADFESVKEVAEAEGARQASSLNQQITYLSDIGAIAPMLGLLGTVIGMIKSFNVLAVDVGARHMAIAEGVAEALVTTAAGLLVGIPAMLFYAFFRGRVQGLISHLESSTTYILSLLAVSHKKKVSARPIEPPVRQSASQVPVAAPQDVF